MKSYCDRIDLLWFAVFLFTLGAILRGCWHG